MPLVITCEHGGADIPIEYRDLFATRRRLLASHRGFDKGALPLARALAAQFAAPCIANQTSRLLVDLNRSESHRDVFSSITRQLPPEERERILARHYRPYRFRVLGSMQAALASGAPVVHLAAHSFVPVLRGATRRADLGLLYDPARRGERAFAAALARAIRRQDDQLVVRRNYPYRGAADGLTTALRRLFPPSDYIGLELEMNQRFARPAQQHRIEQVLVAALEELFACAARDRRGPLGID